MAVFGSTLRAARMRVGVKLVALARALDVSHPYVSDLERGARGPLDGPRILRVAAFLGVDPIPLLAAAAVDRRAAHLPVEDDRPRDRVAVELAARWAALTEEQVRAIGAVIKG